jgi:carbon monoxide dehydrogenase subunit G
LAQAAASDPTVQVSTDDKANAAHIVASIDIAAAPLVVWNVLTDCARMPEIFPNLESCRVVESDPAGKWDVRENVIKWAMLMPALRMLVHNTFDPGRLLTFKRISGDMRISQGHWKLEPSAGGTTLSYDALFAPGFLVPQFMIRQAAQKDMPNLLLAIRKASLDDAEKK